MIRYLSAMPRAQRPGGWILAMAPPSTLPPTVCQPPSHAAGVAIVLLPSATINEPAPVLTSPAGSLCSLASVAQAGHWFVTITGYASPGGAAGCNLALSRSRALAVQNRLVALGSAGPPLEAPTPAAELRIVLEPYEVTGRGHSAPHRCGAPPAPRRSRGYLPCGSPHAGCRSGHRGRGEPAIRLRCRYT